MNNKPISFSHVLSLILLVIPLAGCQSLNLKPKSNKLLQHIRPIKALSIQESPNRILVIWKDAVVRSTSGLAKKGFGGRVYFYGQGEEPIKVDGQLVVYGYDDTEENGSSAPDRKYVFKRENLESHYDPTELGHAYSIWIPWEEMGGFEKTISLMPFFEPVDGKRISAGMSEITLPGKRPEIETVEKTTAPTTVIPYRGARSTSPKQTPSSTSKVVYATAIESNLGGEVEFAGGQLEPDDATRDRTHTIDLPDSLQKRIQNAPPQKSFGKKQTNVAADYREAMNKMVEQRFEKLKQQLEQKKAPASTQEILPAGSFKKPNAKQPVFGQPAPFNRS